MQERSRFGRRVARAAVAVLAAALVTSCGHGSQLYGRHYQLLPGEHGRNVERALVVPVNLMPNLPVGLLGHTAEVSDEIAAYLASHGIEVVPTEEETARQLWIDCFEESRPGDGGPDPASAANAFVRQLREREAFDVLIVPTLVYRKGRLRDGRVRWDGVVRTLPVVGGSDAKSPIHRETGKVAGVSLHVIVFDEQGTEVFHGVGGLDVAHTAEYMASRGRWYLRHREDPFTEPAHVREGVELAFEPYFERRDALPPVDPRAL